MAILVFQHGEVGRPGRLGATFRDHAFRLDIRRLDKGDAVPEDFDEVDGVVSLGGAQNVGGPEPWLKREIEFLREAHARSLPIVGICLGHQLLAAALGAEVGPMEKPEAGMTTVEILPAGHTDTVLSGVAWNSRQFVLHAHEVKNLPAEAVLLASSAACKIQVMRAGMRSYGFQYHFECDRAMIDAHARESSGHLHKAGLTTQELTRQCDASYEMFARLADRLSLNIVTYLVGVGASAPR